MNQVLCNYLPCQAHVCLIAAEVATLLQMLFHLLTLPKNLEREKTVHLIYIISNLGIIGMNTMEAC